MIYDRDLGIPLPDGTRLSAALWMPDDAHENPVPAILEYLPYRKSDGTLEAPSRDPATKDLSDVAKVIGAKKLPKVIPVAPALEPPAPAPVSHQTRR